MKRIYLLILSVLAVVTSCETVYRTDVLIIGGGASGIAAGIQSSRMGVSTMIVEETPWVGGMLTSAGVCCVDGNYRLQSGIFGEFGDSLALRYGSWDALKSGWVSNMNFEPNVGQDILSNMTAGCGEHLTVLRQSSMLDVVNDGDIWTATFQDFNGRVFTVKADILIYGTELGDVAKACGAEYHVGMDSSSYSGEAIAPEQSNDIIQDLTYVAILKDYGPDADMTLEQPEGYDPTVFYNSARNPKSTVSETGQTIWDPQMMITYGRTPNGRYMINWPIYGNDYYVNSIDMSREGRAEAYARAKHFTLCFIYFIQTELGMKNLGIADDVFPTEDNLPLFPYHRESRRIVGESFFTIDAAASPYSYNLPYFRTGIAVGDYAVDHHHFRHPQWRTLPDLHFYPIPSFNVPMGVMLPKTVDNLIVAEKSISVSNIMNGATRLQPVVMQLGQAAGAIAASAVINNVDVKSVSVREVQMILLDAGCYIMPYLDLPADHVHFASIQRIGATGIMRGEGRNVGWSNQTWFRAEDMLLAEEIFLDEFYPETDFQDSGKVSVKALFDILEDLGGRVEKEHESLWTSLGLKDYSPDRIATRLEGAVVMDALLDPFSKFQVDYSGNIIQ